MRGLCHDGSPTEPAWPSNGRLAEHSEVSWAHGRAGETRRPSTVQPARVGAAEGTVLESLDLEAAKLAGTL